MPLSSLQFTTTIEDSHHNNTKTDDILDFARIEHGKLMLRQEVCNLFESVEETVDMFGSDCAKKDIALSLHMNVPRRNDKNKVILSSRSLSLFPYHS